MQQVGQMVECLTKVFEFSAVDRYNELGNLFFQTFLNKCRSVVLAFWHFNGGF